MVWFGVITLVWCGGTCRGMVPYGMMGFWYCIVWCGMVYSFYE